MCRGESRLSVMPLGAEFPEVSVVPALKLMVGMTLNRSSSKNWPPLRMRVRGLISEKHTSLRKLLNIRDRPRKKSCRNQRVETLTLESEHCVIHHTSVSFSLAFVSGSAGMKLLRVGV